MFFGTGGVGELAIFGMFLGVFVRSLMSRGMENLCSWKLSVLEVAKRVRRQVASQSPGKVV